MSLEVELGKKIEIQIERLATGGYGVGRYQGMVFFVPYSAPNDRLIVTIVEIKKNFAFAEIDQILEPSQKRSIPKCKYYGVCGGCNWQHISYEEQLRQKQNIVSWIFRNYSCEIKPIIPSENEWNYRRRVQLHQSKGKIGFLKRNSHEMVEILKCEIARPELQNHWSMQKSETSKFELNLTEDGIVTTEDIENVLPFFSQVNIDQNKNLQKIVHDLLQRISCKTVYDFYCGDGNFTFSVASHATDKKIIGMDRDSRLISAAREKLQQKKLKNIEFLELGDTQLKDVPNLSDSVVILDPPRVGCSSKLIKKLLLDRPTAIIYVSCHPQSAERDIKNLSQKFHLETITPVDMFPQTDHIEIVGLLR